MTLEFSSKVTIMIPTYNQASFIKKSVNSALAQSYPNLEILVGDDASNDSTASIIKRINDPRIKYIKNSKNLGRINNYKNLLYEHASGDYILNLDGDDYYTDKNFVSDAISIIKKNREVIMVVARATRKFGNEEEISLLPQKKKLSGIEILKKIPRKEFFFMHLAVLYERKSAIKINFYSSQALSSDWHSIYRLSMHGKVAFLNKNVGVWRIHNTNFSNTKEPNILIENLNIWPEIYNYSVLFGMNKYLAYFLCQNTIAFFSSVSCIKVSTLGNLFLIRFIFKIFKKNTLSAMLICFLPQYNLKILLCLLGYYRYRFKKRN